MQHELQQSHFLSLPAFYVTAWSYSAHPGEESLGLISSGLGHSDPCKHKECFVLSVYFHFRLFYLEKSLCVVERQIWHFQTFSFAVHAGVISFWRKHVEFKPANK